MNIKKSSTAPGVKFPQHRFDRSSPGHRSAGPPKQQGLLGDDLAGSVGSLGSFGRGGFNQKMGTFMGIPTGLGILTCLLLFNMGIV